MPRRDKKTLLDMYDRLFAAYGPQHWWPAKTATEVVIGAILTQNTAWANVERAIANLRRAGCLSWRALRDLPEERLAELIRPSGTFRVKARRLRAFVDVLWSQYGGSLKRMLDGPADEVRQRLLAISGTGKETADAILLYAAGKPVFVIDAYTLRVLRRHFLLPTPSRDRASRGLQSARTSDRRRTIFEPSPNLRPFTSSLYAKRQGSRSDVKGKEADKRSIPYPLKADQPRISYDDAQQLFHAYLPRDVTLYNEYHALLVAVGKRHCRTQARCDDCPLADLPHDEML